MNKQEQRILEYMRTHGSITQAEASEHLGVARLASRVSDLRSDGYPIVKETETGLNRHGEKTRWARYRMGAMV